MTFAKLREEPDDYPEPITFAIVPGEDGRRSVQLSGAQPGDNQPLEVRIEAQLITGPKTTRALRDALNRSAKDIDQCISNLFLAKRIRSTTVTIKGIERKAFALRDGTGRARDEHAAT